MNRKQQNNFISTILAHLNAAPYNLDMFRVVSFDSIGLWSMLLRPIDDDVLYVYAYHS